MVLPTPLIQTRFWKTPNFSVLAVQLIVQTLEKMKKGRSGGDVLWSLELNGSGCTCGWAKHGAEQHLAAAENGNEFPVRFFQRCSLQPHLSFGHRPRFCGEPLPPVLWTCPIGCQAVAAASWRPARAHGAEELWAPRCGLAPAVGGGRSLRTQAAAAFAPLRALKKTIAASSYVPAPTEQLRSVYPL